MFVGQVPKHLNEPELRTLFEEFGRVFQINVLRDKATKQSKGCCFVTFYTRKAALDAQNALHNVKTLPGMNHPVQMKPADNENRSERKLFVGQVSKTCNEADVRKIFSQYGMLEDVVVLRRDNGESKGCAFVTFASKLHAQKAIEAIHGAFQMEGCGAPIKVSFADTQKDKDQKRQHQQQQQFQNVILSQFALAAQAQAQTQPFVTGLLKLEQLQQTSQPQVPAYYSPMSPLGVSPSPGLSGLNSLLSPNMVITGLGASSPSSSELASMMGLPLNSSLNPSSQQQLAAAYLAATLGNQSSPLLPTGANGCPYGSTKPVQIRGNGLQSAGLDSYLDAIRSQSVANKQIVKGPKDSNLFIYHLPVEFQDSDLIQLFRPYGNILSANVYVDKKTNRTKCFGFVSYDNPASAQMAIQEINGLPVAQKRLKVQLKDEAAKPY